MAKRWQIPQASVCGVLDIEVTSCCREQATKSGQLGLCARLPMSVSGVGLASHLNWPAPLESEEG